MNSLRRPILALIPMLSTGSSQSGQRHRLQRSQISSSSGGGASLAKATLNMACSDAASWRASRRTGGTPGTTVPVALDATLKY